MTDSDKNPPNQEPEVVNKPVSVRHLIVERITAPARLPDVDEEGAKHFWLTYHSKNSQSITHECSAQVWDWTLEGKPQFDLKAEWILNIAVKSNLIVGVVRKPHPPGQGPLPSRFKIDPNNLTLLHSAGNIYEPVTFPPRFASPVLDEVIAAMTKCGRVRAGITVEGRFKVVQVFAEADDELVVVDLLN